MIPTQRGDQIFKMNFREVNCGDADLFVCLFVFKSVIPTQRGDHIFKMNIREVNCCDAQFSKYMENTQLLQCLLRMGADGAACGCLLASPRMPQAPCWPFWCLLASPRGASGHPFVRFECVRASLRGASDILLGFFAPSRIACDFKCWLRIPFFNASDRTKKGQLGLCELMGSFR